MKTGTNAAPAAGRDGVVFAAMMVVRLGFVLAIVLGLGMWFSLWSSQTVLPFHILSGGLVMAGIFVAMVRSMMRHGGRAVMLAVALVAGILGVVVALGRFLPSVGVVHLILMVAAVGLAEMTAAKLKRAA